MSTTFQIPIPAKGQPALSFPGRCVCCGAPQQAESTLAVNRLAHSGKKQTRTSIKYQVPHCAKCARSTKAVFLAGLIPFGLGFFTVGGLTLIAITLTSMKLGLDEVGLPNNANSLVLGAFVGLFAGLIGAFVFELAARIVLLPFFGQALLRAPLLAVQILSDADSVAGLTARLDPQTMQLALTFFNEELAAEFALLNTAVLAKSG